MTEPAGPPGFDTLIYTDCRAGQGLRGAVGLQFQSRSPGADETAMSVVQRNLLYEPPARWMRERRPVSEYPPSFAHTWDGHLATASGIYLGKEVNGSREGNQLTHSVVTRDPASYGPIRPAQLFGAPFWTTEPAPTTASPPVPSGWEPGPFGIEDAQKFVLDQPDGRQTLLALVSALEEVGQPQARRVLFIADAPAGVLHWIAAATLLLPQDRALAVGFKVFTTNPAYASQHVVAVHPEWDTTKAAVENDLGYAVFDLVRGAHSEVEATAYAKVWVPLFCTEDPYDIVDAIEIAAASGLDRHAPVLGLAATLRRPPTPADATILVNWLRDSDPNLLAGWRGIVVDLLAESVDELSQPVLLAFDEVARSGQVPEDRVAPVRLALITAEIQRAYRDAEVANLNLPPLPGGTWQREHQAAAERAVTEALRTAPPAAFDAVLRVAYRFKLAVRIADIRGEAGRFVASWARNRNPYDPTRWPCGEELDAMLVDELCDRILQDPSRAHLIGDGWWRQRWRHSLDGDTPLAREVISAAVLHLDSGDRLDLVERVLDAVPHADDPRALTGSLTRMLWARHSPTHAELRILVKVVPRDTELDPEIFQSLCDELLAQELDLQAVELGHSLHKRGVLRSRNSAVLKLLMADFQLYDVLDEIGRLRINDKTRPLVARFVRIPAPIVRLRAEAVITYLLQADAPELVLDVLVERPELIARYVKALCAEAARSGHPEQIRTIFFLACQDDIPDPPRSDCEAALRRWVGRASSKQLKQVTRMVDELGPKLAEVWVRVVERWHRGIAGRIIRRGR